MNAQHEVRSRTRRAAALTVLLALLTGLLAQVPASASGLLFSDGFETGDLSRWTASSGMTVQQQVVGSGAFSARATATGGAAYVYKTLSTAQSDLYYDGRFDVISSANNNVSLMRLRTSAAGAILTVYRRADGYLYYYNEVTGTTALGPQVSTGVWHELEVHALVNGTSGQIQVWLDGSPVASMTKTDNLGTTPTGRVYVGEPATGRTFDVAFDSEVLSTSADVTAPTTPTAVQASANGANQVNVSRSASTDAVGVTGYTVYRNGAVLTTVPAGTTAYADSSVLPATTYTYAVDAYDGAGNHSALSSGATATTASLDVTPPSVPAGLTATAVSATRVDLTWSASTDNVGVTGYTVYRDGAVLTTVNGSTTSWSDTGASPSTTYSYAVDAFDAGGNHSAASSAQKVTTPAPPDTTAPSVPGALAVTGSASNSVSLSWSASTDDTGVAGYTVYRDGALLATVAGTATTYVDGTVAPETRYGYSVDAFDAAGNHSAATAAVTVTTPAAVDTVPPAAPTGLTATAVSSAKVHVSWTASTDNVSVTGYTVYRNGSPLATTDGQTTAWDDTTVAASTTYTYTVDAFDAGGNHSSQTAGVDATTPAPPDTAAPSVPGSPAATAVGSGRVDVTWTASTDDTGVTGYTVYRGATAVATVGGSTTSFSDTGLTASTTYSYTVDAFDAAGNRSARTAPVSATTAAPADTTAPTVPTGLTGQAVSPTRVDLSWSAASDNVGVAGYTVYRGGAVLANVGAGFTSFSDSSVTHSTTYAYTV
ncbi:MAG: fibronectin type III domain-containing protein, partial [Mycobacteriales bacterium]